MSFVELFALSFLFIISFTPLHAQAFAFASKPTTPTNGHLSDSPSSASVALPHLPTLKHNNATSNTILLNFRNQTLRLSFQVLSLNATTLIISIPIAGTGIFFDGPNGSRVPPRSESHISQQDENRKLPLAKQQHNKLHSSKLTLSSRIDDVLPFLPFPLPAPSPQPIVRPAADQANNSSGIETRSTSHVTGDSATVIEAANEDLSVDTQQLSSSPVASGSTGALGIGTQSSSADAFEVEASSTAAPSILPLLETETETAATGTTNSSSSVPVNGSTGALDSALHSNQSQVASITASSSAIRDESEIHTINSSSSGDGFMFGHDTAPRNLNLFSSTAQNANISTAAVAVINTAAHLHTITMLPLSLITSIVLVASTLTW